MERGREPRREPAGSSLALSIALLLQHNRVPSFCLQAAAAAAAVDDWRSSMSSTVGAAMVIAAKDRTVAMEMNFILTERKTEEGIASVW
jgi:hypothetical protein